MVFVQTHSVQAPNFTTDRVMLVNGLLLTQLEVESGRRCMNYTLVEGKLWVDGKPCKKGWRVDVRLTSTWMP